MEIRADRQTDRQTERETDRQTDCHDKANSHLLKFLKSIENIFFSRIYLKQRTLKKYEGINP